MVKKFVVGAFLLCLVGLNASAYLLLQELCEIRENGLEARVHIQEMPAVDVNGVDSVKVTGLPRLHVDVDEMPSVDVNGVDSVEVKVSGSPLDYPVKVRTE